MAKKATEDEPFRNIKGVWRVAPEAQYTGEFLYRALRPDELGTFVEHGEIRAYCYPCPESACCDAARKSTGATTPQNHIAGANKLISPSNWISTSRSLKIAAMWAATDSGNVELRDDIDRKDSLEERKSSIVAKINPHIPHLTTLDTRHVTLHPRAQHFADASEEVLIPNCIPSANVVEFYECRSVSKAVYSSYDKTKFEGHGAKDDPNKYIILVPLRDGRGRTPSKGNAGLELNEYLARHAAAGLRHSFAPAKRSDEELAALSSAASSAATKGIKVPRKQTAENQRALQAAEELSQSSRRQSGYSFYEGAREGYLQEDEYGGSVRKRKTKKSKKSKTKSKKN